jgi:phospholipid transport system substrate-binding protein
LLASRLLAVFLLLCFTGLGPGLGSSAAGAAEPTPSEIVERLNVVLIEVMQGAEALGFQGRYQRLAPVLSATFDFHLMARISAGRHWRTLDEATRGRFVTAFGNMSMATYASRFDGYGGERFEVLGEAPGRRKTVVVRNHLVKSDGETVAIDYLLKATEGRWRVVDVFLDGKYSELALKRSEYGSVIKNHGVAALIQSLDEKAAKLAAEN